uniref:Uncharacterized protein n=1 Tax=Chaetoceros debilis TaxID=122233 RepID=A0A7S3PYJ0_9STRA|mmetsp:Transcript_6094/g.8964  ORF Transcript_6094/g.8964 Transcript_6094/m.8964 type:complete len:262 (+) Transcript_6094:120-905(+)
MAIIVFACKSNSCRSQMAEAWASEWIRDQISLFEEILVEWTCEKPDENSGHEKITRPVHEHISLLRQTIVASVALDSSAVFDKKSKRIDDEEPRKVSKGQPISSFKRKMVKIKAVEAMKMDSVDISLFKPKTVDEIIPYLYKGYTDDIYPHIQKNLLGEILKENTDFSLYGDKNIGDTKEDESGGENKPVDKLIVLCSCGDSMKYKLARRSKSVEEWSIDAPTAASKAGEGDKAYRRVSLEIRKEVNILMGSLLKSPCQGV